MKNPLTPAGIEPATFRFVVKHITRYMDIQIYEDPYRYSVQIRSNIHIIPSNETHILKWD